MKNYGFMFNVVRECALRALCAYVIRSYRVPTNVATLPPPGPTRDRRRACGWPDARRAERKKILLETPPDGRRAGAAVCVARRFELRRGRLRALGPVRGRLRRGDRGDDRGAWVFGNEGAQGGRGGARRLRTNRIVLLTWGRSPPRPVPAASASRPGPSCRQLSKH